MQILSPDFKEGEFIPKKFTCDGENINPTLHISGVPEGTRCLALVVDDPDAPMGTFVHWVMWNLPYNTSEIVAGSLPAEAKEGENGAGKRGYMGPCPPSGTHRYFFKLFALSATLDLPDDANAMMLGLAMSHEKAIIAQAELVGLYSKDENARQEAAPKAEDRPSENP